MEASMPDPFGTRPLSTAARRVWGPVVGLAMLVVGCGGTGAGPTSGSGGQSGDVGSEGGSGGTGSGGTLSGGSGGASSGGATGQGGSTGAGTGGAVGTGSGGTSATGGAGAGQAGTGGQAGAAGAKGSGGGSGQGGSAGKGSGGAGTGGSTGTGGAATTGALIHNDVFWKDTSGTPIYSQGGGVCSFNGTYYWYGVKYNGAVTYAANTKKNSDTTFVAITCYSSTDLVTWKHENDVLTTASLGA